MAKIYLPSIKEYRDIEQIVAFGCSMTQGAELLDSLRYPDITNIEEFKQSFANMVDWHVYHRAQRPIEDDMLVVEQERQLAWPGQLASLYNIPCYNYAEGGSSFEKQLIQFMDALANGKITDKTLVVWGLTGKERGVWFQPGKFSGYMLNGAVTPEEVDEHVSNFWFKYANSDMMLYWKYYNCLSLMFSWANEYCNDQFLFVQAVGKDILEQDCFNKFELEYLNKNPNFFKVVTNFQNMLRPKYQKYKIFNDTRHNMFNWTSQAHWSGGSLRLAGYHPTLEAHARYALMITEELDQYRD